MQNIKCFIKNSIANKSISEYILFSIIKYFPYFLLSRFFSVGDCSRGYNSPPLLVHPQYRFVLIFSPKSACTSVVIWFYKTMGLLDEARAFSEWPHRFRLIKLQHENNQRKARQLPLRDVKILRVVRDPIDRAASSFRHALNTGYVNNQIRDTIGVDVASEGLSFQQFIDFLELEDLYRCDPHHRHQKHPIENLRDPDCLINISKENLFKSLNAFENKMGMPITNFSTIDWIHELQANRVADYLYMGPNPDELILTTSQAQRGPWPTGLVTPRAQKRLELIYTDDIKKYS